MPSQQITCADFETSLEALVAKRNTTNLFAEEAKAVQKAITGCNDVSLFNKIAVKMFTSDYFWIPADLGIQILRRYLDIAPDAEKEKAKAFLGQWLHHYGMEYENQEEGVRLLQAVADPNVRDTPWNA